MSDVWMGCGAVHRGEPIVSSLFDALLNAGPLHLWKYGLDEMAFAESPDAGSVGVNMDISPHTGGGDVIAWPMQAPDGDYYAAFGLASPHSYAKTQSEILADGYTNGYTVIVVMVPFDESFPSTGTVDTGTMFRKTRGGGSTDAAEEGLFYGTAQFGAFTTEASTTTANGANQEASPYEALWGIFEVYFPPGDSTPILYKDGVEITGADLNTFDLGTRADHGAGDFIVGSNTDGSTDLSGYYAMCAIYDGAISAGDRLAYKNAAITEGWLVTVAETIWVDGADSTGTITSGNYNDVRLIVSGVYSFYSGAYGDAETGGGSLSGHGGFLTIYIGGTPTHIEPVGGPFSVYADNPGHIYNFDYDAGGGNMQIRCGDSVHTDNTGGFLVHIIEV